jgi:hypothetical protein
LVSAAQLANRLHVPMPLVMVTVVPEIVQTPEAVMMGVVLAFVLVETVNCELKYAVAGAPVKVTVGVARLTDRDPVWLLAAKLPCGA